MKPQPTKTIATSGRRTSMRKWWKQLPGFHDAELTALIQDSVNIYSIVRRIFELFADRACLEHPRTLRTPSHPRGLNVFSP